MSEALPAQSPVPAGSGSDPDVPRESNFTQFFLVTIIVTGVTLVGFVLRPLTGYRVVALVYLLAVVLMALFVGRAPTLFAAAASALAWDFFFLAPIQDFYIRDLEDKILFGMYFVVALVLGQLTARIRAREQTVRKREAWATALYLLTRELADAATLDQMIGGVVRQMGRTFDAQIAVLLPDAAGKLSYHVHPASTYDITGPEQPVAEWVFGSGQPAGKFSANHPKADALFVPLPSGSQRMGVVALKFEGHAAPTLQQRHLLDAHAQQIALALDRHRLREEAARSQSLAESERLSRNLLNLVSHEIRTPLAVIKGATGHLAGAGESAPPAARSQVIAEIQEATDRLDRLVGKILNIARLESGHVKPRPIPCDVADLVRTAVDETRRELADHPVTVEVAPRLPLVRTDHALTQQALANLLSNAAFHTPPGTEVRVGARAEGAHLVLEVADRGPGITPAALPRIFEKFYRAPGARAGGTGLGLSLARGFVEAQGGRIKVGNRPDGGAIFAIYLPLDEVPAVPLEADV